MNGFRRVLFFLPHEARLDSLLERSCRAEQRRNCMGVVATREWLARGFVLPRKTGLLVAVPSAKLGSQMLFWALLACRTDWRVEWGLLEVALRTVVPCITARSNVERKSMLYCAKVQNFEGILVRPFPGLISLWLLTFHLKGWLPALAISTIALHHAVSPNGAELGKFHRAWGNPSTLRTSLVL